MLEQDEIERLLAIGEEQRRELMGISIEASAAGSDPADSGSIPESPTSTDGGISSGLDASP